MYNPALFSIRQEFLMPAKKATSNKRKKVTASRKKTAARKVSNKKVAKKKVAKKKVSKKTSAKKKVSNKKVAKKKATKKVAKKTSKKKAPSRKKAVSKKKAPARKKAASKKKAPSGKKAASQKKTPVRQKKATGKAPTRRARPRGDVLTGPIHGVAPYKPRRGEQYMSDSQLKHFGTILNAWKQELMYEVDRTVHHMQDEAANFPDPNDRATQESEFGLELRTRDRERKLLRKIEQALARVEDGTYGFCEETGEEIGLKRLEARPVATLCLEAQERREVAERQFRDRDDRYR
jgi:DnaK suppressor protein